MATSTQISCDICGAVKQATNHWFVARTSTYGVRGIAILPINDRTASDPVPGVTLQHICGESCAHKRLSQWFQSPEVNHEL